MHAECALRSSNQANQIKLHVRWQGGTIHINHHHLLLLLLVLKHDTYFIVPQSTESQDNLCTAARAQGCNDSNGCNEKNNCRWQDLNLRHLTLSAGMLALDHDANPQPTEPMDWATLTIIMFSAKHCDAIN